jgi:peptidoglycan/LPS O-acetylase OafA/YrhL
MPDDRKLAPWFQSNLGNVLAAHDGVAPGLSAMRLAAAFAVLGSHSFPLTGTSEPVFVFSGGQTSLGTIAVCTFFIISGFLVAPSLLRSHSLLTYASKRALRIFPALIVVVGLVAMVLGPLVTTQPLADYFAHENFKEYLWNMALLPRFSLPGVFENLPFTGSVNGSLWTLRYEAGCYILLPLLVYGGVLRRTAAVLIAMLATGVLGWWAVNSLPPTLYVFDLRPKDFLVFWAYFFAGTTMVALRERVPLDGRLAVMALLLSGLALRFGAFHLLFPILGAYLVVYCGTLRVLDFKLLHGRDYSYGFYLYAFPVQQLVVFAAPAYAAWWFNIVMATPVALFFAGLSWHLIEKPMLSFKSRLPHLTQSV